MGFVGVKGASSGLVVMKTLGKTVTRETEGEVGQMLINRNKY